MKKKFLSHPVRVSLDPTYVSKYLLPTYVVFHAASGVCGPSVIPTRFSLAVQR